MSHVEFVFRLIFCILLHDHLGFDKGGELNFWLSPFCYWRGTILIWNNLRRNRCIASIALLLLCFREIWRLWRIITWWLNFTNHRVILFRILLYWIILLLEPFQVFWLRIIEFSRRIHFFTCLLRIIRYEIDLLCETDWFSSFHILLIYFSFVILQ